MFNLRSKDEANAEEDIDRQHDAMNELEPPLEPETGSAALSRKATNTDPNTTNNVSTAGPPDLSFSYKDGPTQPKLSSYVQTKMGSKVCSFNCSWYSRHPVIEYSVTLDAVFCFVCRHFSPTSGYADVMFVENGCKNWKKTR